ncbi:hypothetical protein [Borborobacter arsenicus]|uniref:hypothetical protein n=1 Tax=Borborobacter arsenicus TaxID=1851146 RepID=UPI003CCB18C2
MRQTNEPARQIGTIDRMREKEAQRRHDAVHRRHWSWSDTRLKRLRELGINPIAGLLHHGFGPRADNVLDPAFPHAFAEFALAVARRYPWIESFSPINEPLTAARYSGLYGLWYPHDSDEAPCFRLLVSQCRAVAKAMAAIRLVQTEDFGRNSLLCRCARPASCIEMICQLCPVLVRLLSRNFESRSNKPAMFPAATECFDIVSPFPGDSDVISQVDWLSSIEMKIAARLVWMAVAGLSILNIGTSE